MEEKAPIFDTPHQKLQEEKDPDHISDDGSVDSENEAIIKRRNSLTQDPATDPAQMFPGSAEPHTGDSSFRSCFKVLALNTIPPILIYLAIFSMKNLTLYFLKKKNDNHLVDAFGVAFSFLQVVGTTVYVALCIGLTSCSAQAFGARNFHLFGIYFHRGLVVNVIVLIPCFVILFFADNICRAFGFDPLIAEFVEKITFPCVIGIFFGMIYSTHNAYLNAAEIFVPSAIILFISAIIFWAVSYLLFEVYHMSINAVAISYNCFHFVSAVLMVIYVKIYDPIPGTYFWFQKQSFQELWSLFKYEFFVGSMIFLEWICVEINYLMSGSLPIVQVTAITICTINYSNWYAVPISLADTVLAFMGNSMGERNLKKAKNFLKSGLAFGACFIAVVVFFYAFLARQTAKFYTNDEKVIEKTVSLFTIYIFLYPGDCIQIVLSSGLRALGMERLGSLMFVICFYFIGLPMSYILGFPVGWGVIGITLGYIIGLYVMLAWLLYIYWKVDWKHQLKVVIERLREDKHILHQSHHE